MENTEDNQKTQSDIKLVITEEMRSYIYDMAKWASFLAIIGFVITGITIISAFTVGAAINTNPQMLAIAATMGSGASVAFTIAFLIIAFAIFYPSLLMFKYAAKAKMGVLYGEQASLDEAMQKLKSLFKYAGVIAIIYIAMNVLMALSQLMGGAA